MKKVTIVVGLGLIGGSIARAIKEGHPESTIIGVDLNEASGKQALKLGIIDLFEKELNAVAPKADVVIFATPVQQTTRLMNNLEPSKLKSSLVVTDTGSTKKEIMQQSKSLAAQGITFIGGHPMAGSHKSGVLASDARLFENAYYLLTPNPASNKHVQFLKELLIKTNAKFLVVTPDEHDQMTGMLSHLPHIIAAGLVNQTDAFIKKYPMASRLAAGGFRDITRIASSDPAMWTDILLTNRAVLIEELENWQTQMAKISSWLGEGEGNREEIFDFFAQAKETRDHLPIHKEGAIPAFFDLFIDIPDYSGVVANVTALLADKNISLINLKILETREDINGILQVTFKSKQDLEQAKRCIQAGSDYVCYEK
ncbi:prephenate dehydrogenase [Vagococcus entomophilus]|uniref:Prephenate dehydrogenase n=1 Tax=Vagococcus entomophilus TaxID=1160095 RepID=A0A430AJA5_9ENTE|nr:prephenate dehydrogenase [Vagococcus entomophilus]RSU08196.1 prephenate dehydrogenase [Vagococcus entomophilus]